MPALVFAPEKCLHSYFIYDPACVVNVFCGPVCSNKGEEKAFFRFGLLTEYAGFCVEFCCIGFVDGELLLGKESLDVSRDVAGQERCRSRRIPSLYITVER